MENREAIMTLQAHVVFACEKAELSKAAVKAVEDALDMAISALEKQTCDGCIFNKRWEEDNCIDCARKAIDKYQRPLPEPYTEKES